MQEEAVLATHLVADLTGRLQERKRFDVTDRAADLGDHDIGPDARGVGLGHREDAALDLVGDVRDDLHGVTEVFTAALLGDHRGVHLTGGDVGRTRQVAVQETFVVTDIQIRLGAVLGDENLSVLEGVHGAGIDVEIGIQLLHGHLQPPRGQQLTEAGRGQTLTQRRNNSTGDEEVFRGGLRVLA